MILPCLIQRTMEPEPFTIVYYPVIPRVGERIRVASVRFEVAGVEHVTLVTPPLATVGVILTVVELGPVDPPVVPATSAT